MIVLCEALEVSTSAFYEWNNAEGKPGHNEKKDAEVKATVREVFENSRQTYGKRRIKQSMGKTGSAYDNAITETFFSTLKKELIHGERFKTRKEATAGIFDHIEVFYNRTRMHSSLGYQSPVMYERDVA